MPEMIEVDNLTFEVRRSEKRKTISIIVDRGGQLVISAPQGCLPDTLHEAIRSKKDWIYTKLLDKGQQIIQPPSPKEYLSGEGFFYLGKSYRLQLIKVDPVQARTPALRFFRGQFLLREDERYNGRRHFIKWYTTQSEIWFEPRIPALAQRIGVKIPIVKVMDLGYHWGSCSMSRVNFHWRAIMLPAHIIEYVMVHELTHYLVPNHGDQFWQAVERVIPDWQEQKLWLARNGGRFFI